jgi:hypothetical protein
MRAARPKTFEVEELPMHMRPDWRYLVTGKRGAAVVLQTMHGTERSMQDECEAWTARGFVQIPSRHK